MRGSEAQYLHLAARSHHSRSRPSYRFLLNNVPSPIKTDRGVTGVRRRGGCERRAHDGFLIFPQIACGCDEKPGATRTPADDLPSSLPPSRQSRLANRTVTVMLLSITYYIVYVYNYSKNKTKGRNSS